MSAIRDLIVDALRQADHVLLGLCLTANLYGLAMIYSATRWKAEYHSMPIKQAVAMCIGIVLYFVVSQFNIQLLVDKWRWVVAGCTFFILLLRTPLGVDVGGNRAWLHIPGIPFNIQPAEIVKLFFTMLLAQMLLKFKNPKELSEVPSVARLVGVLLYFCGLIFVISSDAGSALIYVFIFIFMIWTAGIYKRWFVAGLGVCALGILGIIKFLPADNRWRARLLICIDHEADPLGVGFQQTRSYLAVRSGGLTGQGYLNGSLVQAKYSSALPERHTDFIFCTVGEEWGFLGSVVVLTLLCLLILRLMRMGERQQEPFGRIYCYCVAAILLFHVLVNVGMTIGLMPVMGIPLPFMSYGGSSLIAFTILLFIAVRLDASTRQFSVHKL